MAGGIFNPENGFYRVTGKMVDIFLLSVFWLACCIPVVTIGPATAALYNAVARCIRGNERNSWGLFFRTFRANLKVGILTTLVVLPAAAVLVLLQGVLYQTAVLGKAGYVLYVAYQIFLLLPLGMVCYLFPVLSRFSFRTGGLLLNCSKLAMAHLPATVLMGLLLALSVWVCSYVPVVAAVLPAMLALVQTVPLERIFRPYIQAQRGEPQEDET
ncbi:YesL family protein [uncultured Flavonifractor sp.]|uniref:YesL family protein n=1 Tax=uncultured Flavonifractor sp. TaxID=1193534 RepID=UPI002623D368|nr:YesL family protein [uncultured Flavonifractor sp.]